MANFFQGTINTLGDLVQQKQASNLQRETPQYKQALFNLIQAKKQATRSELFRQMLINADPADIPQIIAQQTGDVTELQKGLLQEDKQVQEREFEVNEAIKTFEGLKPTDITHIREVGSLPADALPRLKVRPRSPLVSIDQRKEGAFERTLGTARANQKVKAEGLVSEAVSIGNDLREVLSTYSSIGDAFKGPIAGRTVGVVGKLGASDEVVAFEGIKELTLSNIAKKIGSETGVLTDKDIERITKALPAIENTPGAAQKKINFVLNYIDRRVKVLQKTANITANGLDLSKDLFDSSFQLPTDDNLDVSIDDQGNVKYVAPTGQTPTTPAGVDTDNTDAYLNNLGL